MDKDYIGCLENIFEIDGKIGHEIIQIYLVEFIDKSLYQKANFKVVEARKNTLTKWISLEEIIEGKMILFPNGLIELLHRNI